MTLSIGKGDSSITKGGPATREGKEVVGWNATCHSIRSPTPVVPGVKKKEDWEEHRAGVLESFSPFGYLELVLAKRVAAKLLFLTPLARMPTPRPGNTAYLRGEDQGDQQAKCIHGFFCDGTGCYLCDPRHPHRLKLGDTL
jgi:hypothetical protein